MIARLGVLLRIALRSLAAHKVKSGIVGSILFFGTFLVVSGSALLDSVERTMEKSITSSLAGHLQVYSADAEDALALFGGMGMGTDDVGEVPDFGKVRASLSQVENVAGIVPMGITTTTVFSSNEIDEVLAELRAAVAAGDAAGIDVGEARVRRIVANVAADHEARAAIVADPEKVEEERAAIARAGSDTFWAELRADPLPALDFLDANVAPLSADGRVLYLRAIGTDPTAFASSFDRFYVVDGQAIPEGKRGFLFSKRTYEKVVKNKVARELDAVKEAIDDGARIADDTLLRERIERNARQYQRILYALDPAESAEVEPKLRALLGGAEGDLAALLQAFLLVDDATLAPRLDFFYAEIAPRIRLYEVPIGGTIALRSYTKAGYARSVNVTVWGTYEFKGLENSDLASASNLVDLATWRELYGKMSAEQQAELASIREDVGIRDVGRDDAEAALFGGDAGVEATADAAVGFDEFAGVDLSGRAEAGLQDAVDPATLQEGLVLNAAVLLKDPTRADETRAAIADRIARDGLGLQVVGWKEATGMVGQFIVVMRVVLLVAIFVIFLVALVILNNSMVMATMERVAEIGTMRAIGAQRGFVVSMFLVETLALGLLAGMAGAFAATAFVGWLGGVGIPAPADVFVVLFAGPRLHPSIGLDNHLFGLGTILVVSVLSTLYPAVLAARVAPIVAIQGSE